MGTQPQVKKGFADPPRMKEKGLRSDTKEEEEEQLGYNKAYKNSSKRENLNATSN